MANLIQLLQHALSEKDPLLSNETKRIVLKEFLQVYVLDFLYNHPWYRKINFYGGTCLHIVYGLNRLSEDLDLDNSQGIDLTNLASDLHRYFKEITGYSDLTEKTQMGERGISRTTLKFPLLNQLGLSQHTGEALHLKVEVSPQKQVAVIQRTPILANGRSFVPAHFSLETMMAGKMLACLERNFKLGKGSVSVKGRDFYDLLWFLQQKVQPLEEKLEQDGEKKYTTKTAIAELIDKASKLKTSDLTTDLLPLFEQRSFIQAWLEGFHENFVRFASSYL
jgi:predicted nucleotidyltransferase component of viral defense system